MKTRLFPVLQDFIRACICFLPVILVIRIMEYVTLNAIHNLPAGSTFLIFSGLLPDLLVFFLICLLSLVPFLIVGLISRRVACISWLVLLALYSMFHYALIRYFSITLVPLDQVIFSYTFKEILVISANSASFDLLSTLPLLIPPAILAVTCMLLRHMHPGKYVVAGFILLLALSPPVLKIVNPKPVSYERDFQYYLAINKPLYMVRKCMQYYREGMSDRNMQNLPDAAMVEKFALYHQYHPEFTFIGPTYPLLHTDETPDALGPLFNLGRQEPNLVFIIVESLSTAFSGDQTIFGSYTPFLDSLSRHSLCWNNCLTSSERTFYVLPAMFGSLPYGAGTYLENLTRSSYHLSLLRYLHQNGYESRFFYGGDASFNQMDNFLRRNNIGYILSTWGPGYHAQAKQEKGFKWGYPDHEMFRRSFEVMDSMASSPYLDIYLTLSMHSPFIPPDPEKYHDMFRERMTDLNLDEEETREAGQYRDVFSTILYTDDALRAFFEEYKKRPEFSNTIFFITGDHSLPELNTGWYSPMERFRVPFIIYSPLLKSPKVFRSVMSHLDVTPSVLAMLRNSYNFETHPFVPWLGVGIDTVSAFRSARSVVFIRNNKEMVDYIDSGYCLSEGRLYRVEPGMRATLVRDQKVSDRLQKKLDNYVQVTQYVGSANTLIPIWMMFGKTITGQEVVIGDNLSYNGNYQSDGYISLLRKMHLAEDFKYIILDFTFRIYAEEKDPGNIPLIVFDVADMAGRNVSWNQYVMLRPGEYKPGQWNTVKFEETMDLSYIKDIKSCFVKMFLWNKGGIDVKCDSLVRNIKGYK